MSPAAVGGVTNRRHQAHSRADDLRSRSLRKEAEAREEKEATRQANAAKSASLRALRLAHAATAARSPDETAAAVAPPPRRVGDG